MEPAMKAILFLFMLFLTALCACGQRCPETTRRIIAKACYTEAERAVLSQAILSCVKNGNPMSDEEGEDLVAQCAESMKAAVCPERVQHVLYDACVGERWRRTEP
jgi:hypothetical protein